MDGKTVAEITQEFKLLVDEFKKGINELENLPKGIDANPMMKKQRENEIRRKRINDYCILNNIMLEVGWNSY